MLESRRKCASCGTLNTLKASQCSKCNGPLFASQPVTLVFPPPGTPLQGNFAAGLLCVVAVLCILIGAASLTSATLGVGIISAGAVIGILARIAQAGRNHAELIERIDALRQIQSSNTPDR